MSHNQFPKVAVGAVVFNAGKVLLVKRSNPPAKGLWAIPGGKVKEGETLQQALKREILEETHLHVEPGEIATVFDVIEKDASDNVTVHYVIIDFICRLKSGQLRAGDDAQEAGWFTEEEIKKVPVNQKTIDLLKEKFNFG